jgi:hypothetical protein
MFRSVPRQDDQETLVLPKYQSYLNLELGPFQADIASRASADALWMYNNQNPTEDLQDALEKFDNEQTTSLDEIRGVGFSSGDQEYIMRKILDEILGT